MLSQRHPRSNPETKSTQKLVMCRARPKAVSRAKPSLFGPGQARPLVTAQQRLWPGSEELKAKAAGSGRGFSRTNLIIEICVNYYFSNLL
jgi:hypothetical protein